MKSSSRFSLVRILPTSSSKSAPNVTFFYNFYVHILPTSSSKSASNASVFYDLYVKSSSRYSFVRILPTPSSKSAPNLTVFLTFFKCESCSRYSPVHVLSTTFADQGPQPQKQRPYFGDRGSHFTRKTQGFAPESLFKPEFTRSRTGTLPNYLMMMMMMMMWLA